MTYRTHSKCSLICHIGRTLRRLRWVKISRPWSIRADSFRAVRVHFGTNY